MLRSELVSSASRIQSVRKGMMNLGGIFTALTTPFNADETIAYDKLESNIAKLSVLPFRGYLVLGSTGEMVNLEYDERVEMVKRVKQFVGNSTEKKLLIVGTGCQSTHETIKLSTDVAAAGADAVLVGTPSYYKARLNNDALEQHYRKVADASPVPVILYNYQLSTGIDLDSDVVVRLSQHPNIIGIKDSSGDVSKLAYMVHATKSSGFQVFAASAGYLMSALDVGCVGAMLAASNVLGPQIFELLTLLEAGKREESRNLQQLLVAPNWAITKQFGVSGVKQVMDWLGYYGGPARSPLLPLSQAEKETLKQCFVAAGFL